MKDTDRDQIWYTVQQGHKNLLPENHAEELIKAHVKIYGKSEDNNFLNWVKLAQVDQNKIWLLV